MEGAREIEQELITKYPDMFSGPRYMYGWPKGWDTLIRTLVELIAYEVEKTGVEFKILQIKSKFAGLRFYTFGGNEAIRDYINKAEDNSYKICEDCGKEGAEHWVSGWAWTLCEECYSTEASPRSTSASKSV